MGLLVPGTGCSPGLSPALVDTPDSAGRYGQPEGTEVLSAVVKRHLRAAGREARVRATLRALGLWSFCGHWGSYVGEHWAMAPCAPMPRACSFPLKHLG